MKFGYIHRFDNAKLKFGTYLGATLTPPPPVWMDPLDAVSVDFDMDGNDEVGDCTAASVDHELVVVSSLNAGTYKTAGKSGTIEFYSAYTGYDPGKTDKEDNNPTDTGASLTDASKAAQVLGIQGQKLDSYLDLDFNNSQHIRQAIYLFGTCPFGVKLPKSAMDGFDAGKEWSNITDTDILGGHAIPAIAYDADGVWFVTWGKIVKATWKWVQKYGMEAQARLYKANVDQTQAYNLSASGFSLAQLRADLKNV